MKITIMDYKDSKKDVEVGELKDIKKMTIDVVTGDEMLTVIYNDDTRKIFDSSDSRTRNFYDGTFDVYDKESNVNIMENPEWVGRDHYSYLWEHGDTSEADLSDWW